jgi:hypothetical protein
MSKKKVPARRDQNMFKGNVILNSIKKEHEPWWSVLINSLKYRKERDQQ